MRFMMLVIPKDYEKAEPGVLPDPKVVEVMTEYNKSLEKAGVLISGEGLHPPSMGARVTFSGGKLKATEGPFPDTKETLGGYWMIRVNSKEEAVAWAARCPMEDGAIIEIRQVQEEYEFTEKEKTASADFAQMEMKAR
jgi:hypothetical protein